MATDSHEHEDDYHVHAHVTPIKTYGIIFAALVVLTLLTVGVGYMHLGTWNLVVAVVIATAKASLVVLYFMHMKYEAKFNALVFVGSLLFLGIFLAYTLNDTMYRGTGDPLYGAKVNPATGEYAHGTARGIVEAADEKKQERAARRAEIEKQRAARAEGGAAPAAAADADAGAAAPEAVAADAGVAPEGEGAAADAGAAGAAGPGEQPAKAPAEQPAEAPAKQPTKAPAEPPAEAGGGGGGEPAAGGGE